MNSISASQFSSQSMGSRPANSNIGQVVSGIDATQVQRAPALNQQVGTGFFKGGTEVTSSFNDRQASHQAAMANTRASRAIRVASRALATR